MPAVYADTSALVKRYVRSEAGSRRVQDVCAPAQQNTIVLGRATSVEVASAFARRVREGALRVQQRDRLWRVFQTHWRDEYQVVECTEQIYALAARLLFRHPLRAYDALHIASALAAQAALPMATLQFWTADRRQGEAARSEGLVVDVLA